MITEINIPNDYLNTSLLLKTRINKARFNSLRAINTELINLYWDIGKLVSEKTAKGWGDNVVNKLSVDLQSEFQGVAGFSRTNISRMKQFYETYANSEIISQVVRQLPWGQNIVLLTSEKNEIKRLFYAQMCLERGWSRSTLVENIKASSYDSYLNNQNNFSKTVTDERRAELAWEFKDEYNFDFLSLTETHKERELEDSLLKHISKTQAQLGKDFCFMGRQYKLELDDKEYFVDLLFYHRKLKSMIAIELKATEFKQEHAQQLNWYLHLLDKTVKYENDNPTIGILLCKSKSKVTVEYALELVNYPVGVGTYTHSQLPKEIAELLPNEADLIETLMGDNKID